MEPRELQVGVRHMNFYTTEVIELEDSNLRFAPLMCVDLFAGAGGLSLAAIEIGIKVIAAVEQDIHACSTYSYNLIKGKIDAPTLYEADIMELDPYWLVKEHFSRGETCDLILGGPPCQGFSVHRTKDAGVGDPRNNLILRYFEFVSALRPRAFLMENVPGILWDRHRDYLDEFYQRGIDAGYRVLPPEVLDARNYGVPQRRKRVFILGLREDIKVIEFTWPPKATHGDEKARKMHPQLKPWKTAAIVFEKPIHFDDENDRHMNHTRELIEVFKSTPLNGGSRNQSIRILNCHRNHNGHKDVYGRIDPSKPGPTMTTACINPSRGRFVHPTEHHGITVRQAARFQTFPDSFVFKGGLMAAGAQIGNAVPIELGKVLLETVGSILRAESVTKKNSGVSSHG